MDRSWDYYDDIAHLYDAQYEEPYWKLYHLITEKLIEQLLIKKNLKSPLSILDLGSGTGYWMEYFVERGDKVYCLEPSEKMITIIKMKSEILEKEVEIYQGICEKLPYEENSFDLVNAQGDVFSYAMDAEEGLKEAWRVLKPGGLIIGSVDNYFAFLNDAVSVGDIATAKKLKDSSFTEIGNSEVSSKKFKTRLFTPGALEEVLKGQGFSDIQIGGKVVFGLYEEEELIAEIDSISELEVEHCFSRELIGKAEHLHFSALKPINI
jgi:ubiquinone/menaquinone biosynthesis C-methylase UbiE